MQIAPTRLTIIAFEVLVNSSAVPDKFKLTPIGKPFDFNGSIILVLMYLIGMTE